MYVCICEDKVENEVRESIRNGNMTIDKVAEDTGVTTGCGTCTNYVEQLIIEETELFYSATG